MRAWWGVLLLCLLAVASCSQPEPYSRVIIDTYKPTTGPGSVNTKLSLFDSSGNLTAADSDGNPTQTDYARIDYVGGLLPGTWYIRVEGETGIEPGPYAIRVLLAPDETYAPWQFPLPFNDPDSYEDDNPASGNVPSNPVPIAVDGKLNRYLTAGDVDWFTLTLP